MELTAYLPGNDLLAMALFVGSLSIMSSNVHAAQPAETVRVYVGTYATTSSALQGIFTFTLNPDSGEMTKPQLAGEAKSPSFLALAPDRKHLYSVNEISDFRGTKLGGVSSFSIDASTGKLKLLNQQPSGGGGPAHLSVSPDNKHVAVANYGTGSVALLPINPDGTLTSPTSVMQHSGSSVDPRRQQGPHAHSVNFSPDGRFLYAADLGLDQVKVYQVNAAKHTLSPADPPFAKVTPGAGPRHLAFSPDHKFAHVISEMGNIVTAFAYDALSGGLHEVQTIGTLPPDFHGTSYCAEVRVHPSGKWLYGSNRGHNSIAIFTIDQATGKLSPAGWQTVGGNWPRHFNIDPTGKWLVVANQKSDNITLFRIDQGTGQLSAAGELRDVGSPVCVVFY